MEGGSSCVSHDPAQSRREALRSWRPHVAQLRPLARAGLLGWHGGGRDRASLDAGMVGELESAARGTVRGQDEKGSGSDGGGLAGAVIGGSVGRPR